MTEIFSKNVSVIPAFLLSGVLAMLTALFDWQMKIYFGFDLIPLLCPSSFPKIFLPGDSFALNKDFLSHAFDALIIFSVLKICSLNNYVFQPDTLPMMIL